MKYYNIFQKEDRKTTEADYQYMVEFILPPSLSQDFIARIPQQRAVINRFFRKNKIASYALSLESSKMWTVFKVQSELELMELLSELPLTPLVDIEISSLTVLNLPATQHHEFSLN
jgi:muconolactone delta-isomerase